MTRVLNRPRFLSLPIAGQLVVLLVVALALAQIATLLLTLIFPPQPPPQHSLNDIARALRGEAVASNGQRPLIRVTTVAPPVPREPGWLTADGPRNELADLLAARPGDIRLMFYVPLPAGAASPWSRTSTPRPSPYDSPRLIRASYEGQAGPPGGGPGGGGFPGGGFPGGDFPGRSYPSYPQPARRAPSSAPSQPSTMAQPIPPAPVVAAPPASTPASMPTNSPAGAPAPNSAGPEARQGEGVEHGSSVAREGPPLRSDPEPFRPPARMTRGQVFPEPAPRSGSSSVAPVATAMAEPVRAEPSVALDVETPVDDAAPEPGVARRVAPSQAAPAPVRRGLFDTRPPGHVEGDFIAAQKVGPDQWVVVRPEAEGFPNAWQARVMLWFLIALALVAPLGWLVARWITVPLRSFADAADRLGRDPTAPVVVSEGGAEIGRAARAFNLMQARLRRYVDDRTAMIGAISHDLRTPLARMRFRVERTPEDVRPSFERDIAQMNAMIDSVLVFMRERSDGAARQRVDLRSVLEVAVDDAVEAGGDVELEPGEAAETEIDLLSIQRVFANLLDNAVKYGDRAVVRLRLEGVEAVVQVIDFGPGLPADELDNVFRPFYRTPQARAGEAQGAGLGLATARSIVRAHGGDVCLSSSNGLIAEVRLPVAA